MNFDDKNVAPVIADLRGYIDKTVGVSGVLARLFRTILSDMNYTSPILKYRIRNFCTRTRRLYLAEGHSTSYTAGNIERELAAPKMTIKVFIKALMVLEIPRAEFRVTLYHKHGAPTEHVVMLDLGNATDLEEPEDDPDNAKRPTNDSVPPWES